MQNDNQKSDETLNKMIEKYKNDLIGYYKKNNPEMSAVNETVSPETRRAAPLNISGTETNPYAAPERNSPIRENTIPENIPNIPSRMSDDEAISKLAANGSIIVQVTTANGNLAVPGAIVLIYRPTDEGDILVTAKYTDESGRTSAVTLPTLPKELSEKPGIKKPYISYNIRTQAPGYFIVENKNVPIYDSIKAVQNVNLVPIPENFKGNLVTEIAESGPQDL